MRLTILILVSLFTLGSCCTKTECDLVYESTSFAGFSANELDTVRIVIQDMEGVYAPDTIFTEAVFYAGSGDVASLATTLPFNKRNSYTYYLPATGESYKIDGYEFSQESCNTCFPSTPSSDYYDVLSGYQVNGTRYEGRQIIIRK